MTDLETAPPIASEPKPVSVALDYSLLVIPGLVWGSSFLFIAEALDALAPDGVTFVRLALGFLTLSLFPGVRRSVPRSDWIGIFGLAVLWFAFPMTLFPHAQQHVASALAGMLNGVSPAIAVLTASLFARRWPTRGVVIGLIVGLSGAVLMGLPGLHAGGSEARGVILIMIALASYSVALNFAGPLQQRNGALPVVWRALALAVLMTAPLGVPALFHAHWTPRAVLALLSLGVLGTAVANIAMSISAGRLGVTRASASIFLIPVVSLLLGVLVRGENVATLSLIGAAVCLGGAWLIRRATPG